MALSKGFNKLCKIVENIIYSIRDSGASGWELKFYVLSILFYRYISEKLCKRINEDEHKAGYKDFDYAKILDDEIDTKIREDIISEIGYFLYPSELFCNVVKNADKNHDLNIKLAEVFKNIEDSAKNTDAEKCFAGLFKDFDLNSESKLGNTLEKRNKKLTLLLTKIDAIDFGDDYINQDNDVFGDVYEYLMGMYASDARSEDGQFFTPQEVSELLTKICVLGKTRVKNVYDLTCGSGSLLLKSAKILGKKNVDMGYFGQEVNSTTYNLCRMNMILHGIPCSKFDIACEDTLLKPMHEANQPFEVIVSNPPYSVKWVGDNDITLINDYRFAPAGVLAPKSKADFAFIMHADAWLAENGTAAIVCFPGIMYRQGAEQKIRKYLVDNNRIDCIIQLPENLFFGTSISTCIMVLKKNKKDNSVLFIDASKDFAKETKKNKLTQKNIDDIMKLYADRTNIKYKSKLATYEEIVEARYNLSVNTYVEKEDTREVIDIDELNKKLDEVVEKSNRLRREIAELIKELD